MHNAHVPGSGAQCGTCWWFLQTLLSGRDHVDTPRGWDSPLYASCCTGWED